MILPRVFPVLLLRGDGLVKGEKFKNHKYVGDPINAVRIFNEKEVDELTFLDITASREGRTVSLATVERLADECFMPFAVGGGITNVSQIRDLLSAGAEKVSLNTAAVADPSLVTRASDIFGAQSIVVCMDVKKTWTGAYRVFTHSGTKKTNLDPVAWAIELERLGVGEIVVNAIDRDGTQMGYDVALIRGVAEAVGVPVIACGGAGSVEHFAEAVKVGHASAVSAGAFFVFHGPNRAVLINFPDRARLEAAWG